MVRAPGPSPRSHFYTLTSQCPESTRSDPVSVRDHSAALSFSFSLSRRGLWPEGRAPVTRAGLLYSERHKQAYIVTGFKVESESHLGVIVAAVPVPPAHGPTLALRSRLAPLGGRAPASAERAGEGARSRAGRPSARGAPRGGTRAVPGPVRPSPPRPGGCGCARAPRGRSVRARRVVVSHPAHAGQAVGQSRQSGCLRASSRSKASS